jgi:predicted regulator of Ras-like GTPase activity (Roadblock/LC7/MglB family)
MSHLQNIARTQLAKLPEVVAFVVTDDTGTLLEASGDVDGESLGAIHVVARQALARCGAALGIGLLDQVAITGAKRACILTARDQDVLGVYIDSGKLLSAFEKKLDGVLRR